MRNSTLIVVCIVMCVGLTAGMQISSRYPHYGWDDMHYPKDEKPVPVPVIYKKVDSVLPVFLSLILSQFFRQSSTALTDTETLRENGVTVITENPCC